MIVALWGCDMEVCFSHPINGWVLWFTTSHIEWDDSDTHILCCFLVHIWEFKPRMILLLPCFQCLPWAKGRIYRERHKCIYLGKDSFIHQATAGSIKAKYNSIPFTYLYQDHTWETCQKAHDARADLQWLCMEEYLHEPHNPGLGWHTRNGSSLGFRGMSLLLSVPSTE